MGIKVKAKELGYYDNKRRYEGDTFYINDEKEFSKNWMEKVVKKEAPKEEESKPRRKAVKKDVI